jgi:hypothetical protein
LSLAGPQALFKMIALELHSPEPPEIVVAALRARAGVWRESELPPELRRAGITAIDCEVYRTTCLLTYERRWYGAGAAGQFLRARAIAEPEASGSRVRLVVECRLRHVSLFALGNGFAAFFGIVALGRVALLYLAFPLSVIGMGFIWMRACTRRLSRRTDREADYLLRRIEAVVADVRRAPITAQASQRVAAADGRCNASR